MIQIVHPRGHLRTVSGQPMPIKKVSKNIPPKRVTKKLPVAVESKPVKSPIVKSKLSPLHPAEQYARDVLDGKILACRWVKLACQRHFDDMRDAEKKGLVFDWKAAQHIIDFFEKFLVFYEGEFDDKPFLLQPWQQFILASLFGWKLQDGSRRFRTAYCEIAKGNGKAMALNTPIPTPYGWTEIGQIIEGDEVFGEDGVPCEVIRTTPVMKGESCYQVEFDDGSVFVVDAWHLWKTDTRRDKKNSPALHTTVEIADTLRNSNGIYQSINHSIPIASPLKLSTISLPLPPYTLGVWLSDGEQSTARITKSVRDSQVLDEIRREGVSITPAPNGKEAERWLLGSNGRSQAQRNDSFQAKLNKLSLLNNKHIPADYLRASISQRLALLQGLLDTDGYISKSGEVEYCTTTEALAHGCAELIQSLGMKITVREGDAKLYGRVTSHRWRIFFWPSMMVFRLQRKKEKIQPRWHRLADRRAIVACTPVASVPVRCITVNNLTGMYLAGKSMVPTHNSPMAAGIGLYGLVFDQEPGAEVYSCAVTREQANILFRDACVFAEKSPSLSKRLEIGVHNIAYAKTNSFFRPISSEHRGLDGKRPHMALIDEIHEHPSDIVVNKMRAGTKGRKNPLIFEISNSGSDRQTVCFAHHEYSEKILQRIINNESWFAYMTTLDVCDACAASGATVPTEGCPDCDDWRDPKMAYKANPNLGISIQPKYIQEQVNEAINIITKQNIVKRLNFGIWCQSLTKWISSDRWNACDGKIDLSALMGRRCYGGLDLSSNTDTTSLVWVFPPSIDDVLYRILCRFFIPKDNMLARVKRDRVPYDVWVREGYITATPGNIIDYGFILKQIGDDCAAFDVRELAFDRWGSQKITTDLQELGFEVKSDASKAESTDRTLVQFGQGYASMSAPSKELEKMVIGREIAHGGNPVLTWMASNVVVEGDAAGNVKPSKEKSTERIDGIVALVMSLSRALMNREDESIYEQQGVMLL